MSDKNTAPAGHRRTDEEKIDESIDESFPASDPPAHGGVTSGAPEKRDAPDDAESEKDGNGTRDTKRQADEPPEGSGSE